MNNEVFEELEKLMSFIGYRGIDYRCYLVNWFYRCNRRGHIE